MSAADKLTPGVRAEVGSRDRGACRMCGRRNERLDLHHIRYRRSTLDDVPGNLASLCRRCHETVHGLHSVWGRFYGPKVMRRLLYALIEGKYGRRTGISVLRQWNTKGTPDGEDEDDDHA